MKIFKEGTADRAGTVSGGELEMINALSKKELTAGEVFTFSLVLCDNEIDRDFERFEVSTLEELAGLFVGRTGISDHEWASARQVARIYRTEVVRVPERVTEAGEEYVFLKAWAYMLRTEANEALIAEIEGGIKKETSVGCSVRESVCSVCGAPAGQCGHVKGQMYDGAVAHVILRGASDAYEWSFVAVPAQRGAGVTKAFANVGGSGAESAELKSLAEAGRVYLSELRGEVLRLCLLGARDMYGPLAKAVESMGCAELGQLRQALEKRVAEKLPIKTQLPGIGEVTRFDGGDEYKI